MGKYLRGILGSFIGKVANIEGYSNYNKGIIRSKQKIRNNPNTTLQHNQRQAFKAANKFSKAIYNTVTIPFLSLPDIPLTLFFYWYKLNAQYFPSTSSPSYSSLVLSSGNLTPVTPYGFDTEIGVNWYTLYFDPSYDDINSFADDTVFSLVYNITENEFSYGVTYSIREDEATDIIRPLHWAVSDSCVGYLLFYNSSLNRTSPSRGIYWNYP